MSLKINVLTQKKMRSLHLIMDTLTERQNAKLPTKFIKLQMLLLGQIKRY